MTGLRTHGADMAILSSVLGDDSLGVVAGPPYVSVSGCNRYFSVDFPSKRGP